MTRVIGALTLTFVLGSAAAARAQDPSTPMDPVVVTATKTETPVGQTGASVSVITREQIEQRQVTDVLQILRDQPGLSLSQTGSRGAATSVFIRGGNNDMNLVLIDGMKVNLGGGAFDFGNITTVGIGRVEVVRGPQSALYGADAMTGVIQFFTPRGEGPFSAWVSAEGGNYATYEARTGFSWGNKYAGVFFEYGHVSTQGILPVNNDNDNDTLALRLDLSPIPELDFTFTGRYVASHLEVPTEGAGDRFDTLEPHQFENVDRLILTLGGRYRQTSWLEHRVKLLDAIAALRNDASGNAPSVDAATTSSAPSAHPEDRAGRIDDLQFVGRVKARAIEPELARPSERLGWERCDVGRLPPRKLPDHAAWVGSVSPVRIRTTRSSGITKIFPSPTSPVRPPSQSASMVGWTNPSETAISKRTFSESPILTVVPR